MERECAIEPNTDMPSREDIERLCGKRDAKWFEAYNTSLIAAFDVESGMSPAKYPTDVLRNIVENDFDSTGAVAAYLASLDARNAIYLVDADVKPLPRRVRVYHRRAAYEIIREGKNPAAYLPSVLQYIVKNGWDENGTIAAYLSAIESRKTIDAEDGAGLTPLE